MLDIKDIKNRKDYYKGCFLKREYEVDLDEMLALYDKATKIKQAEETLLAQKNKGAKEFEIAKRNGQDTTTLQEKLRENTRKAAELTKEYNETMENFNKIYYALPNIVTENTPAGGKENNIVLKEYKQKPTFNFKPKTHIELCKNLGLIDYERATKIAGEGNWIYTGLGARLEWAILNFA